MARAARAIKRFGTWRHGSGDKLIDNNDNYGVRMNQQYVFETTHRIYYSTENPVPVGEIARALLALEKIVSSSETVFEGVTAVEIDKIEVLVAKLESGSLIEDIVIKFFFKDQAGLDAFVAKVRGKTLENGMVGKTLVVGSVLAAVIGAGAYYAASMNKSGGQTTITANNNVIINIGAGEVGMTPEAFKAVVEAAVKDKKGLAESTVQLFRPARADRNAAITLDGDNSMSFSPDVIAATPTAVKGHKDEDYKRFSDVDLQIRATDLDSQKRGWAGVIPGLIDRRIPIKLADNVLPTDLNHFQVRADVTVYYKRKARGSASEMVPDYVIVQNVIK